VKFFWPTGHSSSIPDCSMHTASWLPGDAIYGLRPATGASCS
jgi:hypothetical protein